MEQVDFWEARLTFEKMLLAFCFNEEIKLESLESNLQPRIVYVPRTDEKVNRESWKGKIDKGKHKTSHIFLIDPGFLVRSYETLTGREHMVEGLRGDSF